MGVLCEQLPRGLSSAEKELKLGEKFTARRRPPPPELGRGGGGGEGDEACTTTQCASHCQETPELSSVKQHVKVRSLPMMLGGQD